MGLDSENPIREKQMSTTELEPFHSFPENKKQTLQIAHQLLKCKSLKFFSPLQL